MRGRQPAQRLPRAQARHRRRHHRPRDPEAERRQPLPRGPHRAVLARGPRGGHRRGVRDGDRRRVRREGEARSAGHGHRPHERRPGVEDMLVAGRVGRRPAETRPVRRRLPLHPARRDLHQVRGRGPRAVGRAGDRHRRRLGRVRAPSGARRRRLRAPRTAGGRPRCRRAHAGSTASSAPPATPARASSARSGRSSRAPRGGAASRI